MSQSTLNGSEVTPWEKLPPTKKQAQFLRRKGYDVKLLNRGQATEIIDRIFKEEPRR